jgi:site-specific DNA recombinase
MPDLRAREAGLKDQIAAVDAQAADRDAYLKLADDLEGFLARLRGSAATATTEDKQRVLRALVQDILIGPGKITIRHRIPVREPASGSGHHDKTDTEGDMRNYSLLRWGREVPAPVQHLPAQAGCLRRDSPHARIHERELQGI